MTLASRIVEAIGLPEPIHLLGIGGAGMSALAEVLLDCGLTVTGCDRHQSGRVAALRSRGVPVWVGDEAAGHLPASGSLVYTAAAGRTHPEVMRAHARGITVLPRSLVLGRLSRAAPTVCVAGSHGKSTVTALTAHLLSCAGRPPTYLVGGVLRGVGRGGQLGGTPLVMETDEFDRTLERVRPTVAVITNVEPEHLDVYGDLGRLHAAFGRFARRARKVITWNAAPPPTPWGLLPHTLRCGTGEGAFVTCTVVGREGTRFRIRLCFGLGTIEPLLASPGAHSAANATLAACAAWELGASLEAIATGLETYPGLERRFEVLGTRGGCLIVSDYAHHPSEIRATLETASLLGRPVVAVFQPHLYSRTALLFADFARSFGKASAVVVTPIYAARERPLPGVSSENLVEAIRANGTPAEYAADHDTLVTVLDGYASSPCTVVFLSAGDLDAFAREFTPQVGADTALPAREA